MVDVAKIKELTNKIKLYREKYNIEKDGKKKQIILKKIMIYQLQIQIERLK